MPAMEINGGQVAYELLGPADGDVIVLTPGGRFSMEVAGLRPFAERLADGGMRVLLWDRPNCGKSDVQFFGKTESHMRADTLAALLRALDLGPVVIAGGSGGARDSILTTIRYPELARRLVVWWIVGGVFSTMSLGAYYAMPSLHAVRTGGIEAVLELPEWSALLDANPGNRDRFLALGAEEFQRVMLRWLNAYVPKPGQTIPGVEDEEFGGITVPTIVIRSGENDMDHPKRTSMEVHCLVKGSRLVEPPWPEDAWERGIEGRFKGADNIFDPWQQAAPLILDFVKEDS